MNPDLIGAHEAASLARRYRSAGSCTVAPALAAVLRRWHAGSTRLFSMRKPATTVGSDNPKLVPHVLRRAGASLFGLHVAAVAPRRDFAIVFCNAFGREFEIARTQIAHFLRLLAARGVGAYRFDYLGYGDSEGEFEDASFSSMCADVHAGIGEAKRRCAVDRVVVAGLRFGAIVAQAVAAQRSDTVGVVMWSPTLEPWAYFYETLRQTVSMQTALFRDVKMSRDVIVENALAGRPSLVDGYDLNCTDEGFRLGPEMVSELRELSPARTSEGLRARTLMVHITKKPEPAPVAVVEHADLLRARGVDCTVETATEVTLPWLHENVFAAESPELFGKTLAWLGV
jgi:pimeloyl-ACP methyl ester carboxylesterase